MDTSTATPTRRASTFPIRVAPELSPDVVRALQEGTHPLQADQPHAEPDRSVWRILSCALASRAVLSDEQLRAALPTYSLDELAAARARVADRLFSVEETPAADKLTLADLARADLVQILAEPSITRDEAIACGLMRAREEKACAPST